jgi:mannose-6-phosphate isomerase-like protein (cupin superfamily)
VKSWASGRRPAKFDAAAIGFNRNGPRNPHTHKTMNYAHKNLCEIIDVAVQYGYADNHEARFPGGELGASATGLAYLKIKLRRREPFAHRHGRAEEIFVVLSGTGRVELDKELVDVGRACRSAPLSIAELFEQQVLWLLAVPLERPL